MPELAMLSVMAHPELQIAEIAIEAISQLPPDRSRLYLDVIMMALPATIRRILEARMQGYEYQSDFARKYYGQGISEGLERGRKKGKREGKREGKKAGLRAAVMTLARTKLGELPDDDIAAIEAVSDQRILTKLIASLGQARSTAKARARWI